MTADEVRREVRAWLEANWDPDLSLLEWRNKLADSGWGCPTWPSEWYGRGLPVALGDHTVAVLLAVLCEQDERRGVRRLEAEHQREEDERVDVPREVLGREPVPEQPDRDEAGHVEQEPGGAHEAREPLGEGAERLGVVRRAAHEWPAEVLRRVEADSALSHG